MAFVEKTVDSELLYDSGFFKMYRHEVLIKNGKTSQRVIIGHNGAVGILGLTGDDRVVLVRQYRKAFEEMLWEIPAGKIDDDEVLAEGKEPCSTGTAGFIEDSLPTAVRELREETGYEAVDWKKLTSIYTTVGFTNEHVDLYSCRLTEKGSTDFDEGEDLDMIELPFEEVLQMCMDGRIKDAKTVAAVLICAQERNKGSEGYAK